MQFGLGSKFRKPLSNNTALLVTCGVLYVLFTYLLLAEPDGLVALFHIASVACTRARNLAQRSLFDLIMTDCLRLQTTLSELRALCG